MEKAFRNEYDPTFLFSTRNLEAPDSEHKEKWLKLRRYEYYQRNKKSVNLYGTISPDMLMSKEEVEEIKKYLSKKDLERKTYIDGVKTKNDMSKVLSKK